MLLANGELASCFGETGPWHCLSVESLQHLVTLESAHCGLYVSLHHISWYTWHSCLTINASSFSLSSSECLGSLFFMVVYFTEREHPYWEDFFKKKKKKWLQFCITQLRSNFWIGHICRKMLLWDFKLCVIVFVGRGWGCEYFNIKKNLV